MPAQPVDPTGTSPADESAAAVHAGRIRPGAVTVAVITAEAFLLGAAVALLESGPLRWVAGAAGLLVLVAHAVPVRGRRLYRWIPVLVRFRRGRAAALEPSPGAEGTGLLAALLPALRVTTSSVGRAIKPVGVAHDGQAWVGMLAVDRDDLVGGQSVDLPLGRLAAQLDVAGGGPGSVQVLLRLIPSGAGTAPLARQIWIALRLDPLAQRSASGRAKSVGEVQKALARGVHRAAELLESAGVRCRVLDDDGVREALRRAQAEPGDTAVPAVESRTALTGHARHTTYRLQRWPSGGFSALLATANGIAASTVTMSATVSAFEDGEAALSAQVRTSRPAESTAADRETEQAAAGAGVRLVSLHAEQTEGFLATLPLGRAAAPGHPGAAGLFVTAGERLQLPLAPAGLVLGQNRDGLDLHAQLLRPRPTHAGLFGPVHVAQVLALRMLVAGVPVHVVTGRPALWAPLGAVTGDDDGPRLQLHPPGSGPEQAGSGLPMLVVDDTEGLAVVGTRRNISAWQAVIVVRSQVSTGDARLLRSYDAVLFQRLTGRTDALGAILPADAMRWAAQLPPGVVGIHSSGTVSFANLAVTPHEQNVIGGLRGAGAVGAGVG